MNIELTQDEYDDLLIILGFATAFMKRDGLTALYSRCFQLANAIGRNSPHFKPYAIPEEGNL